MIAPLRDDERGSVLPLVAGYAALGLAVILVAINALSLFVAQKHVDALADAAALAASDGFEIVAGDAGPSIRLDPATAARQAQEVLDVAPGDAVLVGVDTASESTARATVAAEWQPFLLGIAVPASVDLRATSTSRAALAG